MSRLVDCCPISDDEHVEDSTVARNPSTNGHATNVLGRAPAPGSPGRPVRDLVPKSTIKPSTRKVRRLGDATPKVNNPLFRRWNADDDVDTAAMRGSPRKARSPLKSRQDQRHSKSQSSFLPASQLSISHTDSDSNESQISSRTALRGATLGVGEESEDSGASELPKMHSLARESATNESVAASSSSAHNASQLSVGEVLEIDKISLEDDKPDKPAQQPRDVVADALTKPVFDNLGEDDITDSASSSFGHESDSDFSLNESSQEASREISAKLLFGRPRSKGGYSSLSPRKKAPLLRPAQPSAKATISIFDEDDSYYHSSDSKSFLSLKSGASQLSGPDFKKPLRLKKGASTTQDLAASLSNLRIEFGESSDKEVEATASDRASTPPLKMIKTKSLVSPSKRARIPNTPHRPSGDSFWSKDVVDDWNDQHSPRKVSLPPVDRSPFKNSPKKAAKKTFEARKHELAQSFLQELDDEITEGRISELAASTGGVQVSWSRTLNTTAGRANWKRETVRSKKAQIPMSPGECMSPTVAPEVRYKHHASIELAEKVIDDEDRLLNVLAHEWCHLANFMINGVTGNPHGREFKAWAARCSKAFGDRGVEVTTKHSFDIDFKYVWACAACAAEYKRHSKSIDPRRHRCGSCKGELKQTRPVPRNIGSNADGTASKPSEYQTYMKEQMKVVRLERPGSPQKEVMKLVAERWAAKKDATTAQKNTEAEDEENKENDDAQSQLEREMAEQMQKLALST